jgi:hypothetical protein
MKLFFGLYFAFMGWTLLVAGFVAMLVMWDWILIELIERF